MGLRRFESLKHFLERGGAKRGPAGNISDPYAYLQEREPGNTYRLETKSIIRDFDGYVIKGHNACAICAAAAVITYHQKALDGIDFAARLMQCRETAVSKGYVLADNYYLPVMKYKSFANDCLALYHTALRADSDLFFLWNSARRQIDAKHPVLLNIWKEKGSGYYDHTVVAYGWLTYVSKSNKKYRFYKVRDGYDAGADRYVDAERLGLYYITKIC